MGRSVFVKHGRGQRKGGRPDIEAATRGGDWSQRMEAEGTPEDANLRQALYWTRIYAQILVMEESVLDHIRQLMRGARKPAARWS